MTTLISHWPQVQICNGHSAETGVMRMTMYGGLRRRIVRVAHHSHASPNMADGVGSRPHSSSSSNGVLPDPGAAGALPARVSRTRRRRCRHVEFLLVAQKEIPSGETPRAVWAFKGLLLGMRTLVAFQMLQTRERPGTCRADMRSRLVSLWWRNLFLGLIIGFCAGFCMGYR